MQMATVTDFRRLKPLFVVPPCSKETRLPNVSGGSGGGRRMRLLKAFEAEAREAGQDVGELIVQFYQEQDEEQAQASRELTIHWFSHPLELLERFRGVLFYETSCPLAKYADRHKWWMSWDEVEAQPVRVVTVVANETWKLDGASISTLTGLAVDDAGKLHVYWFRVWRYSGDYWSPPDEEAEFIWCSGLLGK